MARSPNYYFRGVASIAIIVLLVAGCSFFIDAGDMGTGVGLSTTMPLTLVALHFVAVGSLPRISYPTRTDKWLFASYLRMLLLSAENGILNSSQQNGQHRYLRHV